LLAEATARARSFGASHVELRHVERQFEQLPFRQHKLGMRRDLPSTTEALWAAVDRKIRNQVRKAQKEGLEAVTGGAELVDEFYTVFAENMRDLGTPVYPPALFSETLRLFPDRAKVSVVRYKGRAVAAGIVIGFRDVVLNPWASSLREFRHLCPNMLLYWTLLEQAVRDGAHVFDFGRSSPGGGTHQFKLQWGAAEVPLHWEYVLLSRAEPPNQGPSNPKFERAIRAWQRLPLSVANVLGPRIARHLP
jgi:FemAB-related protein (PEP-CTERM system-associated)